MAERKTVANKEVEEVKTQVAEIEQPLNLDQIVTLRSIANWDTTFSRRTTVGDIVVPKRGTVRLTRNEVIQQSHGGNTLINGTDLRGSHATYIIDDEPLIKELGFENAVQFSDDRVKALFEIKTQPRFEAAVKDQIVTDAEKYSLMISILKQKLNDFNKIRFCENYTGYKLDRIANDPSNKDILR